jgi:hypothetical protein
VAKYHHYCLECAPDSEGSAAQATEEGVAEEHIAFNQYKGRCHMREWPLDGMEWFPPALLDAPIPGNRDRKVPCHGIQILICQDYDDFFDVDVAQFDGRAERSLIVKIRDNVQSLTAENPAVWGWEKGAGIPLSEAEVVVHWNQLLEALPYVAADVCRHDGELFHPPSPADELHGKAQGEAEAERVDGVAVSAMEKELAMPHSTFLNVDDNTQNVQAIMEAKAATILKKRKEAAEEKQAKGPKAKRGKKDATGANAVGGARGNGGMGGFAVAKDANGNDGDDDDGDDNDNEPEEMHVGDGQLWPAVAFHGLGTKPNSRVFVVWNNQDREEHHLCEQNWASTDDIANWHHFVGHQGTYRNLCRDRLKVNKDLVGTVITGSFSNESKGKGEEEEEEECLDEDGNLTEDGLVTDYNAKTKRHSVKWLGGINLNLSEYPTDEDAEIYQHDLMMQSKQMFIPKVTSKGPSMTVTWKPMSSILIKWYYDEDVPYGTEAGPPWVQDD